ncbi:hypothetical protein CEP68_06190 [Brevundimonas vesicularis]|uniref:DUF1376 domain-containing protein n=2 Tax=Brevundimonas vesicularis TaxID=41276 RepID=A0A1Z3U774_BREVE|nr:hypothetical protein CEP68_06190 [Brevundimonas vesicularis]
MIDVPRLFASGFNATASRNPLAWMIGHKLWYRSWHQVPAGSLPADPDELCHLAELGFDRTSFNKARTLAMRGWVECDDGRLYHPVVCEAALESWQEKLRQRLSSGIGNEKRWKVSFDTAPVADDLRSLIACMEHLNPQSKTLMKARKSLSGIDGSVPLGGDDDPSGTKTLSHRDDVTPGTLSQETGTGTGTGIKKEEEGFAFPVERQPPSDVEAGRSLVVQPAPAKAKRSRDKPTPTPAEQANFDAFWAIYPRKVAKQPALEAYLAVVRRGVAVDDIARGALAYAGFRAGKDPEKTAHATTWLNAGRWTDEIEQPPPGGYRDDGRTPGWNALDMAAEAIAWPENHQ